jgi:Protein of unknown function (DUF3667)
VSAEPLSGSAQSVRCANCGATFAQPRPRFCPACGQESNLRPPRLGEFLQQFGGAYFATEGALWRTLKLLLLKPGELTRQYLAGRRKHYVLPLRLYLSISLITLLLVRLATTGMDSAVKVDWDMSKGEYSVFELGDGTGAGLKDGVFFCNGLPQWLCKRLERRLVVDPKSLQREATALGERAISNVGAAMFVLLPLFALCLKLVYLNRRLRYTEHLVFALHLHAGWFILLALMLLDQPWLTGLAFMALPVYTWTAMRRVYGGRWWPLLLRSVLVSSVYGVMLSFAMVAVVIWALLF